MTAHQHLDTPVPSAPGFGPSRIFRGTAMRETFAQVKALIGPEAVILATRDLGPAVSEAERFEVVAAYPAGASNAATNRANDKSEGSRSAAFANDKSEGSRSAAFANDKVEGSRSAAFAEKAAPARTPSPSAARTPSWAQRRDASDAPPWGTLPEPAAALADAVALSRQVVLLEQAMKSLELQLKALTAADKRSRATDTGRSARGLPEVDLDPAVAALTAAGLEPEVAREIVRRAVSHDGPRQAAGFVRPTSLASELERIIHGGTPLWALPAGSICALVGPPGAGKTTTLLKIAGLATFAHGRSVACISTDVARLGAFEQLRLYGEVMGIPVVAARDQAEVERALERFADRDLVLIDTAGHNPSDEVARRAALAPIAFPAVRQHVVVPATLAFSLLADVIACYEGPAVDSLVVTRLDEVRGFGAVVACGIVAETLPVSHVCDGQDIPDHIGAVDAHDIADQILARVP